MGDGVWGVCLTLEVCNEKMHGRSDEGVHASHQTILCSVLISVSARILAVCPTKPFIRKGSQLSQS